MRAWNVAKTLDFQCFAGKMLQEMLSEPGNRIGRMLKAGKENSDAIESLYLTALSRFPTTEESARLVAFVGKAKDRRLALEDVVWGLVYSKEFLLRR